MWLDQPAPMEAPAAVVPPPDTIDQVQLREAVIEAAAIEKTVAAAPPPAVAFDALSVPPSKDAVIAPAESRPWWLAASPQRAEISANNDAIAIPPERTPTTADRVAAGVTAVWIGGSALAAVIPEPPLDDDEEQWPPPAEDHEDD